MIDKEDIIVSLLKGIDLNIDNLGSSETDVLLSNRITTLENSVKTINTGINDINTTNTTQTTNITNNTNKIDTANLNITNLTTRVTNVENKATTNESNITTLNERVITLENAGPSGDGGGYPVVTVTEDFNIEAQPNTFYNIKNSADSEVTINCSEGYSVDGKGKHIMFTFDGWDSEELADAAYYFAYIGGVVLPDTTKEGYSYKIEFDLASLSGGQMTGIMLAYFTDEIKTGSSVNCLLDMTTFGESEVIIPMNNIQVLTDNVDDLVWVTLDIGSHPHIFTEVENDSQEYQHKYTIWGIAAIKLNVKTLYTNEPYITATNFYLASGTDVADMLEVKPNISIPPSDIANEFVFNINSPANITFNQEVKWNNNTAPDLTQTGICTISIVNGVGCYTFV